LSKELENLYLHTIEAIQKGELKTIDENLMVLKEIVNLALNKSANPQKSFLLKEWNKYINIIGTNLISKDFIDNARDLILSIYKAVNEYNSYNIDLEPIIEALLKRIKSLDNYNKILDISFLSILWATFLNINENEKFYDDNNVPYFFNVYYYNILKNNNLKEDEKNQILNSILNDIFYLTAGDKVRNSKDKIRAAENIFLSLLKIMIDQNDLIRLKKLIKKITNNYSIIKEINLGKISIITSIYLYYLAYKENLPTNEKQMYQKLLLDLNLNLESLVPYESNNTFWEQYETIKNELSRWERFLDDEEAKWLMMGSVVREFFLFYNAADIYYGPLKNQEIDESNLFQMIQSLLTENEIKENTLENYRKFKHAFGYLSEENRDKQELQYLAEQLLAKYKQIQLNKVKLYAQDDLQIKENNRILQNLVSEIINSNKILTLMTKDVTEKRRSIKLAEQVYPINFFFDKNTLKMFQEIIDRRFNDLLFNEVNQKFNARNIRFRDTNKTNQIFEVYNFIESNGLFKINSVLNGLSKNSGFFYTEEETNLVKFNKLIESIPNQQNTQELIMIGFDNRFNTYDIGEINVDIRKLTSDEINLFLEKNKFNNNLYNFTIVNDLGLLFEEKEAQEFISLGYRVLDIQIEMGLTICSNTGFIIKPGI
jgi:hypothetical protein